MRSFGPTSSCRTSPSRLIPSISPSGTFYADAGDARISMVDARDVAAVAAVVLTEPGHDGAHYDVTGPEALSYADVAAKLGAALRRPVSYADAPDAARCRQGLLGAGLSKWFADALVGLYQDYRLSGTDGYAAQVSDTVERLTGRRPGRWTTCSARSRPGIRSSQDRPLQG